MAKGSIVPEGQKRKDEHVKKHFCCIITAGSILAYLYCMVILLSLIAGWHGTLLLRDKDANDEDDKRWGRKLVTGSLTTVFVLNLITFSYNLYLACCNRHALDGDNHVSGRDFTYDQKECMMCLDDMRCMFFWILTAAVPIIITITIIVTWSFFVTRKKFNAGALLAIIIFVHILSVFGVFVMNYMSMCNCCIGPEKKKEMKGKGVNLCSI